MYSNRITLTGSPTRPAPTKCSFMPVTQPRWPNRSPTFKGRLQRFSPPSSWSDRSPSSDRLAVRSSGGPLHPDLRIDAKMAGFSSSASPDEEVRMASSIDEISLSVNSAKVPRLPFASLPLF